MQQEREGTTGGRKILVAKLMVKFPKPSKVHLYSSTPRKRRGGKEMIESDKARGLRV